MIGKNIHLADNKIQTFMKKLNNIHLTAQNVLNQSDMKKVVGGNAGSWCYASDGEGVGPFTSCSDAACEKLYGPGSTCR